MCRMLATATSQERSFEYELLTAPHSLCQQSRSANLLSGLQGPHGDGAGMAWVSEGRSRIFLERRGGEDPWDAMLQRVAREVNTHALIAHNRKASPGLLVDQSCSHPYLAEYNGEPVAFCHNGGVATFMDLAKERGVSDSTIFLDELVLNLQEMESENLRQFLTSCEKRWDYSSLNGMLLTKNALFVWRCFNESDADVTKLDNYYTLFMRQAEEEVCIASEPVDEAGWVSLPNRSLIEVSWSDAGISVQQRSF